MLCLFSKGERGESGKVWVWGDGADGQLGLDFAFAVHRPVKLKNLMWPIAKVVAGRRHTLASTNRGMLLAWGFGGWGELGFGDTNIRIQAHQVMSFDNNPVEAYSTSERHTLIVVGANTVRVRDNPQYEKFIKAARQDPSTTGLEKIRAEMAEAGLNPDFLDTPDAVLTAPIPTEMADVPTEEPGLKYCWHEMTHEVASAYEVTPWELRNRRRRQITDLCLHADCFPLQVVQDGTDLSCVRSPLPWDPPVGGADGPYN
jgi:hypothetical protein